MRVLKPSLSNPSRRRLGLCLVIATLASGCSSAHSLGPISIPSRSRDNIAWLSPLQPRDSRAIARWRAAVGSPVVTDLPAQFERRLSADSITIVSWNVALDGGDVEALVRGLQARAPATPIVLLLQEVFRSADDVPGSTGRAAFAGHLGRSRVEREIDDVARALGMALYYVPSMRNGTPGRYVEDRGNAVLSSLPLGRLAAIELPFMRQRRVAMAATVSGRKSNGEPWALRLANAHLDGFGGFRNGWIAGEYGRGRQARALREALAGLEPTILGGDFNTVFGFSDQAYLELALAFPQTSVRDRRRTFRGLLRLDHVFFRLPGAWKAEVRRGESSFGSDHHPLITTVTF